jgi:hypothetical protein
VLSFFDVFCFYNPFVFFGRELMVNSFFIFCYFLYSFLYFLILWGEVIIIIITTTTTTTIQFFIIYVPSQQLQSQLQTQRSVGTSNYIMDKHNIKSKSN